MLKNSHLVQRLNSIPKAWDYSIALTSHTPSVGESLKIIQAAQNKHWVEPVGIVKAVTAVCLAGGRHFAVTTADNSKYIVQRSGFNHRSQNKDTFIGVIACKTVTPGTVYPDVSPLSIFSHEAHTFYTADLANLSVVDTVFIPDTNLMVVQLRMHKNNRIINVIATI